MWNFFCRMHFYMAIQKSETYNSYKLLVTNSGLLFLNKKHAFISVFKTSFIEIHKPHVLLTALNYDSSVASEAS